ncbi:cytochrome c biogenesis protein CcdA [Acetomicrobium sp.]|uniref:cytochrome c biogenesis CcdA family protein n=1 Tax=Acetomicrobium sp. TaxID=1872099 RepID=UPI001BCC802E|nr:cytochrome c biogenesis protein CcdA [Acetomicrobium sp.]
MSEISLTIAFAAGLLSFLSPCLLPMIPIYIAYLAGDALPISGKAEAKKNFRVFLHALLFVLGFSVVFVSFGASATALGSFLIKNQALVKKAGATIIVIFGLYMIGLFDIAFLERERRLKAGSGGHSWIRALLAGMAFSAGWTPCVGPILASILVMASGSSTVRDGMLLLFAYSMGLGLPFLAVALFMEWFERFIQANASKLEYVKKVAGVVLIAVGLLMYFDLFSRFAYLWTPPM